MKKFEYKTTYTAKVEATEGNLYPHTIYQNESVATQLNDLGAQGWELLQIITNERNRTSSEGTYGGSWGTSNLRVPVSVTIIDGYYFIWKREIHPI
ncbi:MAG: DUF4177 domain-containing protein [Bacteroidia bacterium]|nr:DUF4177 domain-containing protein [Bacteroidia bacterium]